MLSFYIHHHAGLESHSEFICKIMTFSISRQISGSSCFLISAGCSHRKAAVSVSRFLSLRELLNRRDNLKLPLVLLASGNQRITNPSTSAARRIKLVEIFLVSASTALTTAIIIVSASIPFSTKICKTTIMLKTEMTRTIPSSTP